MEAYFTEPIFTTRTQENWKVLPLVADRDAAHTFPSRKNCLAERSVSRQLPAISSFKICLSYLQRPASPKVMPFLEYLTFHD